MFAARAAAQELRARGPDPAVVKLGGSASFELVLENFDGPAELVPPAPIDGLAIDVRGPVATSSQVVSGGALALRRSLSWELVLEPARAGRFELPAFEVRAGGRSFAAESRRLECVQAIDGTQYAFVELSTPRRTCFVNELLDLKLRLGVEREFLRSNLVQLFSAPLDVPVQLEAAWLDDLPGAVLVEERGAGGSEDRRASIASNDRVVQARVVPDERRPNFLVLEIERTFRPQRSGELRVPAPALRFACATKFADTLATEAVPADWQLAFVRGEALAIDVEPLPDEGRPHGFGGAVGRFSVTADASPRTLRAGESVKLALTFEGQGNLDSFDPPRLEELASFRIRGYVEAFDAGRRVVTYDVAPVSDAVRAIPPIHFSFFDTEDPPGYRTLSTDVIPLNVSAPEDSVRAPAAANGEGSPASELPWKELAIAAVALAAVGMWMRIARLRRRLAAPAIRPSHSRQGAGVDAGHDLARFLAAHLGCSPAAVIGPDLERRLLQAGIEPELATRAARLLDQLIHARYGGERVVRADELQALVAELERAFASRRSADR